MKEPNVYEEWLVKIECNPKLEKRIICKINENEVVFEDETSYTYSRSSVEFRELLKSTETVVDEKTKDWKKTFAVMNSEYANVCRSRDYFEKKLNNSEKNEIELSKKNKKLESKYETSLTVNWTMGLILIGTVIFVLVG